MSDTLDGASNVVEYVLAHRTSDAAALFYQDQACSHRELADDVDRTAAWLLRQGLQPGNVVAVVADNSIQWVKWYFGVMRAGGAVMPLPGGDSSRVLQTALGVRELKLVFCQSKYAAKIAGLLADRPAVQQIGEDVFRGNALDAPLPARWPAINPRRSLASIMMTSGSTGDPKGVEITHGNIRANTASILDYLGLVADDRMMVVLPFFYCYGLSLLHTHLRAGGSVVLNNLFMFPGKVLEDLAARRCTGFAGVPSTYQILLRKTALRERPLPDLRHVQQAGGGLGVSLLRELRDALPRHTRIFVMYGATEATSRLTYLPPERLEDKLGSIGVPIPGVVIRVCDEYGRELQDGETGELVASGPNIAHGYHGENGSGHRLHDGKLFTGDMGWRDADGFLWLASRKSEFIKSYGFRISPREIEDVICALPQVVEALVVGVKDEEAGEAIAAYVVPVHGSGLTAEQVRAHCLRNLPNQKIPQRVELRDELPKNEAGKLLRNRM